MKVYVVKDNEGTIVKGFLDYSSAADLRSDLICSQDKKRNKAFFCLDCIKKDCSKKNFCKDYESGTNCVCLNNKSSDIYKYDYEFFVDIVDIENETDELEDLLIEFNEMGFMPSCLCDNSKKVAIVWKDKLVSEILKLKLKIRE